MRKPLAIDLFCGLGGWTESLLAEGWRVIGFDIERHDYGSGGYPGQLVLQDVRTLHGAQFKDADLIVASPPCQEFSYRAMPWKRAKALPPPVLGINLFWQCWKIQHEACEAAGRYIPLVVENVKGAQPWIGRAKAHFGSFYLWGDVASVGGAVCGPVPKFGQIVRAHRGGQKQNPDGTDHPQGSWFKVADSKNRGRKQPQGSSWFGDYQSQKASLEGTKCGGDWFNDTQPSLSRLYSSKSPARKAASAQIAKIPEPLARHIAQVFKPAAVEVCA